MMIQRAIAILLIALCATTSRADLTDSIDISAGGLPFAIPANTEVAGDIIGAHDLRRISHILKDKLWYQLKIDRNKPLTLEVEETDGRETQLRAYLVFVDGKKQYLRTWE